MQRWMTTLIALGAASCGRVGFGGIDGRSGAADGAPLDTVGMWSSTSTMLLQHNRLASAAYQGFVYAVAGDSTSSVEVAPINPAGDLGAWGYVRPLPGLRDDFCSVLHGGRLYAVAGWDRTTIDGDVLMTTINSDGTLGLWTTASTLPVAVQRWGHGCATDDRYLYVVGGCTGAWACDANQLADVSFAPFNTDGTLGTWVQAVPLPSARGLVRSLISNGYLYALGGRLPGAASPEVDVAPINIDGSLGNWISTTPLPGGRDYPGVTTAGGFVYVLGGGVGATFLTDVIAAPILADGTLGAWSETSPLPAARKEHESLVYGTNIYVIGGWNGTTLSDTMVAPL